MRTAARRPTQDDAALDYARDAGYYARQVEITEAQLEEAKRKLAPLPLRKRVWGLVSSIIVFGFTAFVFYLVGEYRAMTILENRATLPTAIIPTRTMLPTPPNNPPAAVGGEPAPTPAYEGAIRVYNEQQEQRATALEAAQEGAGTPNVATDAEIDAWLAAPVSTATPLPEPGDAGFAESFEDAPECSPFIGYVAGSECARFFAAETATAGE